MQRRVKIEVLNAIMNIAVDNAGNQTAHELTDYLKQRSDPGVSGISVSPKDEGEYYAELSDRV